MSSIEDILNTLTKHFATHVQTTKSSIKNLEKQVGQLAEAITRIDARTSGNLPSQTGEVRRENVSAVTLRSGKQLHNEPIAEEDDKEAKTHAEPEPHPRHLGSARGKPLEEETCS